MGNILTVFTILLFASKTLVFAQNDPIAVELGKAEKVYENHVAELDSKLIDQIESLIEITQKKCDLEGIQGLRQELKEFSDKGILPASVRTKSYSKKKQRALSRFLSKMEEAKWEYTRNKQLAAAELLQQRLKEFKKIDLFSNDLSQNWIGDAKLWSFTNGELQGTTNPAGNGQDSYLVSKNVYQDFEMTCKVRLSGAKADSGFMFRGKLFAAKSFRMIGPQCNIGSSAKVTWGTLLLQGYKGSGFKSRKLSEPHIDTVNRIIKQNQFNDLLVRCRGKYLTISVNGEKVVDGEFEDLPDSGKVGWQLLKGAPMELRIKDAKIYEFK